MAGEGFHWLDVERIAEELADTHPELEPMSVRFPELRSLVESLEGFEAQPGHAVNERILEAIQMHWLREVQNLRDDDDD